jgi:hypothetical protein
MGWARAAVLWVRQAVSFVGVCEAGPCVVSCVLCVTCSASSTSRHTAAGGQQQLWRHQQLHGCRAQLQFLAAQQRCLSWPR